MTQSDGETPASNMGLQIKDLGGFSQPMTKLIEVISAGIGTLYRPRAARNDADAKAYEISALARAEAEAVEIRRELETAAAVGRIELLAQNHPEFAHRARQRLLLREIEGQLNIEAIAEEAIKRLPGGVSEEPVSPDWRRKFFMEADSICSTDLQLLWGKVLAGEVATPGSFSLRTLEVLKNVSQQEAELFRRVCSLAMIDGWVMRLGNDINTALVPFDVSYDDLLTLRDAGLVHPVDELFKIWTFFPNSKDHLQNNGVLIRLSMETDNEQRRDLKSVLFTKAGTEIQRLVPSAPNENYLTAMGVHLRSLGIVAKRGVVISQEGQNSTIDFETDL